MTGKKPRIRVQPQFIIRGAPRWRPIIIPPTGKHKTCADRRAVLPRHPGNIPARKLQSAPPLKGGHNLSQNPTNQSSSANPGDGTVIRVGIAGAGFISQIAHLPAFSRVKGASVVALCDARPELLAAVGGTFVVERLFPSIDAMIAEGGIDALVVSLPRRCLGPAVLAGLEAGLPVLSEKPMAMTLDGARRLAEVAERSNQTYAVGFMKRYDPGVALFRQRLDEWIESNRVGAIEHVIARDFSGSYACEIPSHVRTTEKAAGRYPEWPALPNSIDSRWRDSYDLTMNIMLHDINLLRLLFGDELEPVSFRISPQNTQTAVLAAPTHDVALHMGRSEMGIWDQTIEVYFERGRLELILPSPLDCRRNAATKETVAGETTVSSPPESSPWAFFEQAEAFLDQVRNNNLRQISDGRDCLRDMEIADRMWGLIDCSTMKP